MEAPSNVEPLRFTLPFVEIAFTLCPGSRDVKQGRIVFQFEASSLIPLSWRRIWRGANIQLTPQ